MNGYKVLALLSLAIGMAAATPVPIAENAFADFLRSAELAAPSKESFVVKRRIVEDNADRQLKQISLSSLIGDIESNLFASALSANKVLTDKNAGITEITEHDIHTDQSLTKEKTNGDLTAAASTATTTESITTLPVTDKQIVETTEKVPQSNGIPTHIVIDRISIQPNTGGIALIPIFELKRTTKDEDVNKDHEITKITISKTEITGLASAVPESTTASSTTTTSTTSTTSTSASTSSTTEAALEAPSTTQNIEQLKEAEEELKEKVAEIEAEPIILSARV